MENKDINLEEIIEEGRHGGKLGCILQWKRKMRKNSGRLG